MRDSLDSGELASLIGFPLYDNGDIAELSLTSDEWAALLRRRRSVGWPLHFTEVEDGEA